MTIAVLGTGLMGTSIALAARRGGDARVVGHDPDEQALQGAVSRGAVEGTSSLEEAAAGAEIAFVCAPVSAIPGTAARALRAGAEVVTDVGSAKAEILVAVRRELQGDTNLERRFVPGHPMTGSERSGPSAGSASLLEGATWVLTPTEETSSSALDRVERAVRAMGALPVRVSAERHDRMVALVSHLPQVASTALMRTAAEHGAPEPELMMLASGGFRDLTRLASSNPELWTDILLANRQELVAAVDAYVAGLKELAGLVSAGDADSLTRAFADAKQARLAVTAKPTARTGVAILSMPVPDKPGVLADITSLLGDRGVNIEDLEIVHSAEGARGTVHLTVEAARADAAVLALEEHGYRVVRLA